jgi:SSS family solute:Na+ symporter
MHYIDWIVLFSTILLIVLYGIYKSRGAKNIGDFLLADQTLPWYHIGLSVMATQASAITFLSAPGQAYTDGMRFVQFYFGLPIAMVVLCITFVPIFHRLKVYTAYEFLEKRFDLKTRSFTAFLFLIQRGLSTGVTIYAPSIILSTILDLPVNFTTIFIGSIVIIYTVYGGTKAVSYTHLLQMGVIFTGMFIAGYMVVKMLPENISFTNALQIAGKTGKMNVIDWKFDLNNRYNVWSGLIGGFFLALSYFGTDQSQVGRYLSGKSISESRLGLIMNGLVKIPMQFLILLIGILVFVFYQFHSSPIFFNKYEKAKIENSIYADEYKKIESEYHLAEKTKQEKAYELSLAIDHKNDLQISQAKNEFLQLDQQTKELRNSSIELMKKNDADADTNDSNYIFLNFVTTFLPTGLVGLLIAIIFLASMGSTASALNSLASTSIVDIYKRLIRKDANEHHYLSASRWATIIWGIFCIITALFASKLGNLIEAVNILGSLFYGTILGIFLVAFYFKSIKANAVFYAAIISEILVIISYTLDLTAFLWLNLIGCVLVIGVSFAIQASSQEPRANS